MRRTLMPRASPVGVGSGFASVGGRRGYDCDHVARFLVFGCRFYLVTVESDHDRRVWLRRIELQGAPGYGDLAATDTKEPTEIDYRRARLTAFVDEQVDDAAHGLIGGASDLPSQDPALRRRLVRAKGSVVHGCCQPA